MSYRASRSNPNRSRTPPADISLDQHISGSITTIADGGAYVSTEINCPKLKEGYYMVIHSVDFELTDCENLNANGAKVVWQLSDEEETALLHLDDEDLICNGGVEVIGTLAQGQSFINYPQTYTPKLPILYPHDRIYFGVHTTAAGAVAGDAYIRIHFAVKQISDYMVNMVMKKK